MFAKDCVLLYHISWTFHLHFPLHIFNVFLFSSLYFTVFFVFWLPVISYPVLVKHGNKLIELNYCFFVFHRKYV
jgi:hypothetical protein